jgi:hypothetical protein
LTSAFDEPRNFAPKPREEEKPVASPVKGKNPTQSKKLQNLTSNISGLQGGDANQFYHKQQNTGQVVDFVLTGLGPNVDEIELKRLSGAKHVISSNIDVDNLKGTCTGTGRIKIRLNDGEDSESIRTKFSAKGILAQDFKIVANKNTGFSTSVQ